MQLCMAGVVWCQSDSSRTGAPHSYIGIAVALGPTLEQASIAVPDFADCGSLRNGTGARWSIAGLYEPYFGRKGFALQLRAGLAAHRGTLSERIDRQEEIRLSDGSLAPVVVDQVLDFSETAFFLSLFLRYPLFDRLHLQGGFGGRQYIKVDQTHRQVAVSPDLLLLNNNRREEDLSTGVLIGAAGLNFLADLGLAYDLPIGSRSTLSPEIMLSYGLDHRNPSGSWGDLALQAGVSLRFGLGGDTVPVETVPHPQPPPDTPAVIATIPKLVPTVLTQPSVVEVRIDEYDSTEALPLLNQIFFPESSAELQSRYIQLKPADIATFSNARLVGSALDVYYQILNIIGKRLEDFPHATLTINGYRNGRESSPDLSRRRAEGLRAYLVDVWHIAPSRIKVTGGKLPPNPSSETSEQGFQENARAELIPSDPNVTAPVLRRHVQRVASPPSVVFYPRAVAEAGIASWKIDVMEGGTLWKRFAGTALPDSIRWNWRGDSGTLPTLPMRLGYELSVTDRTNRTESTPLTAIDVMYHSRSEKLEHRENDTTIESYSLLLFNFDSPKVSEGDRALLRAIAANIRQGATVRLTGYTDSLGGQIHNRDLAMMRAEETAKILRVLVPRGVTIIVDERGGERERFPYLTPEGRAHCRTVIIEVRTPSSSDGS